MLAILRDRAGPPALRMQACTWLADRAFGKPVQQLDATMALDVDATVSGCSVCAAHERAREAIRANLTERTPTGSPGPCWAPTSACPQAPGGAAE